MAVDLGPAPMVIEYDVLLVPAKSGAPLDSIKVGTLGVNIGDWATAGEAASDLAEQLTSALSRIGTDQREQS